MEEQGDTITLITLKHLQEMLEVHQVQLTQIFKEEFYGHLMMLMLEAVAMAEQLTKVGGKMQVNQVV